MLRFETSYPGVPVPVLRDTNHERLTSTHVFDILTLYFPVYFNVTECNMKRENYMRILPLPAFTTTIICHRGYVYSTFMSLFATYYIIQLLCETLKT